MECKNDAFSNVSSSGLPKRSHIGCVFMTFLRCVFSNVSSKNLHKRMQSHIGCICWTFCHCVFSNVSSNCLPEKRHSHIGCTCLTFLLLYSCFSREYLLSIGPTFTKINIYEMLTHHHQGGNVVPCVMSLSKLFKPIEAQYCSSEFPIWTENKLLNWSEWQQYTFTFNIKIWVNGNQLPLSQWELFNKLDRPPSQKKRKRKKKKKKKKERQFYAYPTQIHSILTTLH